jgi:hypothetical protein
MGQSSAKIAGVTGLRRSTAILLAVQMNTLNSFGRGICSVLDSWLELFALWVGAGLVAQPGIE